jgi:hypothetical protein
MDTARKFSVETGNNKFLLRSAWEALTFQCPVVTSYMCPLIQQSVTLHFVFVGFVWSCDAVWFSCYVPVFKWNILFHFEDGSKGQRILLIHRYSVSLGLCPVEFCCEYGTGMFWFRKSWRTFYYLKDSYLLSKDSALWGYSWKNHVFGLWPSSNVFFKNMRRWTKPEKTWFFKVQYTIVRTV